MMDIPGSGVIGERKGDESPYLTLRERTTEEKKGSSTMEGIGTTNYPPLLLTKPHK